MIRVDPESNDRCPYKRRQRRMTEKRAGGNVPIESGTGVMQTQAQGGAASRC